MNLIYKILGRLSILLLVVLTAWASVFYFAILNEVNDELDDSLEDYSAKVMTRALAGRELPSQDDGTNNSYNITPISSAQAERLPHIHYIDSLIFVAEKDETEAARILRTIFHDAQGQYYQLTVSTPSIEKQELVDTIFTWLVSLYVCLLLLVIALVYIVFRRNMRPLYVLLKWLDQSKVGSAQVPLGTPNDITEFRQLYKAVDQYATRASQAFEQQKQFISNASHEIQTPLAICQNRVEMLMDHSNLTEEQLGELAKTRQTLEHIVKLNKSLLFLSKIDNRQFPESSVNDFNAQVKVLLEDFSMAYAHHHLSVTIAEDLPLRVTMNSQLATALLTNLIKNAYVYTPEEGEIIISLHPGRFEIRNTACGIPLDANKIFDRFYKGGSSGNNASGLGLAIVASIVRLYRYTISYRFSANFHYFTLSFPVSE